MTVKWEWHKVDEELPDRMGAYLVAGEHNYADIADFDMEKFTYPGYHLDDTWTFTETKDITDKVIQWAEIPVPPKEDQYEYP